MSSLSIGVIVFACLGCGTLLGIGLRQVVPGHHLSAESKDALKLGIGLIGTMSALVLGLLVASAKASYDNQSSELTEMAAKVVLLDRVLSHYGPEAKEAREALRAAVSRTIEQTWMMDASRSGQGELRTGDSESLFERVQTLAPQNDAQRTLHVQAVSIVTELGRTRWLMAAQGQSPMPRVFLVVVVLWMTLIFVSFGFMAPVNASVLITQALCALSVAAAIFLILELYRPFQGFIQLSSSPLQYALAHMGR